jgi:hypothetical protein
MEGSKQGRALEGQKRLDWQKGAEMQPEASFCRGVRSVSEWIGGRLRGKGYGGCV